METGIAVSTQTIKLRLSLEFGIKSCKSAQKPRLTQMMKKKCLDFTKRHASWDIDIEIKTFSIYENTLIMVLHDCIVHWYL